MDIQVVSGFLGAGKTTFLNQYIPMLSGKTVVIENEYGDISIDGGLIEGETEIREITAGCICCTLAGEFHTALAELAFDMQPDHILIEPTGVGKLSDIIRVCEELNGQYPGRFPLSLCLTVVDISEYEENKELFGEFYLDQIAHAGLLFLSHTQDLSDAEIDDICRDIRKQNPQAVLFRDDFRELDDASLSAILEEAAERGRREHDDHHHDHDEHHDEHYHDHDGHEGHHHDHEGHHHGHDEHHHDHDGHHHDHDGHHHHDHDGHHHADDIFSTVVLHPERLEEETPERLIRELKSGRYGRILRAKGYIRSAAGELLFIDMTSHDAAWRPADEEKAAEHVNDLVIIGCDLDAEALQELA